MTGLGTQSNKQDKYKQISEKAIPRYSTSQNFIYSNFTKAKTKGKF